MIDVRANIRPGEQVTSRETWKALRGMDHKAFDAWAARFYETAFRAGAETLEQAQAETEIRVGWDDLRQLIAEEVQDEQVMGKIDKAARRAEEKGEG